MAQNVGINERIIQSAIGDTISILSQEVINMNLDLWIALGLWIFSQLPL